MAARSPAEDANLPVSVVIGLDPRATGRLWVLDWVREHTLMATARPGSGMGQNPNRPIRRLPWDPHTGAERKTATLPATSRKPACRREGGQHRNSQERTRVNNLIALSTWIQPHLTSNPFSVPEIINPLSS